MNKASLFNVLLFIFILYSCKEKDIQYNKLNKSLSKIHSTEFNDGNILFVIPNSGCTGCINAADQYLLENVDSNENIFYILTNVFSKKDVNLRLGIDIDKKKNILIDKKNILFQNGLRTIYPSVLYLKSGEIANIDYLEPGKINLVFSEINYYLLNNSFWYEVYYFFILETPSHLNSSFLIAKSLRSKGYEIIYIIFSNKYLELLSNEGFKYEFIKDFNISRNRTNNFFSRSNLLLFYQAKSDFKREFLSGSIFNSIIRKYNPSLFIVDLSLIFYSIILWEKNIPFIITCTKVSLNFDKIIPPFTSNLIPKFFRRNFKDKIIILLI